MAWYNFKNKRNLDEQPKQNSNKSLKINKNKLRDFAAKTLTSSIRMSNDREQLVRPEYNLWEIKEALEADSYVKISISKYTYLIYKEGASLKGEDKRVSYLEKRFRLMSFFTGKPMDVLFQEVADDLTIYSNAFLIKKRIDQNPLIDATPIFSKKIVGGYYRADPASIKIRKDKNGNIIKYEQGYNETVEFDPIDVIHIYMDKDSNNSFGTPRIIAALDDVRLLRKIEGNITALIYRFSMPLYQWIIGLPEVGFQATDPEIMKAQREIENSTLDGVVVTNERTNIKTIGAEGSALNAEGYLKYFEDRCFSALGVSASQMGRGGAKQDADSMEAQIHDTVKYIQRILSIFIEEKIINELLLEGGFNPILNEEDIVKYEFEEISLETKIKKENHELLKYQGNMTTLEESRRKMGMKDSVEDEERLYKNLIEKKTRIAEIDRTAYHQKQLVKNKNNSEGGNNNVSTGNKSPRNTKDTSPNDAVLNNNMPKNQHGTHSVKIKEGHNVTYNNHNSLFKDIYQYYEKAIKDIEDGQPFDIVLPLIKESICYEFNKKINEYSYMAIKDAIKDINENIDKNILPPSKEINLNSFYKEVDESITSFLKAVKQEIKEGKNNISTIFDSQEYKLKTIIDFAIKKAYWYSYIKVGALTNIDKAYIIFSSEKDAKGRNDYIDTKLFSIDDIPAYHSFCKCEITYNKKKAGEKNRNRN